VRRVFLAAVALGAALWALSTATASSDLRSIVTFTPATITVSAPGGRVVITRDPYRLAIEQPDGRSALSEVADHGGHPVRLGPTQDPRSPGVPSPIARTSYAPLSFLVGTDTIEQYDGGLWGGNLKSGSAQGTWYSARRVLSATIRTVGG
jgi:hypothetical protein